MRKNLFSIVLIVLSIDFSIAQNAVGKEGISVEKLKSDFQLLRYNLEKIHTGLYTYTSKNDLDKTFDSIQASINTPSSSIDFYRKISTLHKVIKNGHTGIIPSQEYGSALRKNLPRFPIDVYWDRDTLYILRNNSNNDNISEGDIIKSINGESAKSVFQYLVNKWTRDGYNLTKPTAEISDGFSLFYGYFIRTPEYFNLEVVSKDRDVEHIKIKGFNEKEINEKRYKKYNVNKAGHLEKKEPALTFRIEDGIGVMTVKDFSVDYYKKTKQNYKTFFQISFEQLNSNQVQKLVIDLRNNTGGNTKPTAELLSYFVNSPFIYYKRVTSASKKIPNPKHYSNKLPFWNLTSSLWLKKQEKQYQFKRGEYGLKPTKPSEPHYKGKVYVLINAYSFSATGELASLIKDSNIGIFIGEEAGGNACQNTSGYRPLLTLPNSKIRVLIPTELFTLNVNIVNNEHGIIPDYEIKPTIDDILKGKDVAMEYVTELIKSEK